RTVSAATRATRPVVSGVADGTIARNSGTAWGGLRTENRVTKKLSVKAKSFGVTHMFSSAARRASTATRRRPKPAPTMAAAVNPVKRPSVERGVELPDIRRVFVDAESASAT